MAYLNLDPDFFDHPKVYKLEASLGPCAEVYILRIWAYAAKFCAETGNLNGIAPETLEARIRWTGTSGMCVASLLASGFLKKVGNDLTIHDWKNHQGHIHKLRERNKKNAIKRWEKIRCHSHTNGTYQSDARTGKVRLGKVRQGNDIEKPLTEPKKTSSYNIFADGILKDYFGKKPGDPDPNERAAVAQAYERYGKSFSYIFNAAKKDPVMARRIVDGVVTRMTLIDRTATMETVAKWADEYMASPEGYDAETAKLKSGSR